MAGIVTYVKWSKKWHSGVHTLYGLKETDCGLFVSSYLDKSYSTIEPPSEEVCKNCRKVRPQ